MKRFFSTLLALVLLVGLLCLGVSAETVTSGDCGENLTWSYDTETNTMTISGTGSMYDYSQDNLPEWCTWRSIRHLIFERGVTRIGNNAFVGCLSDTIVHIPDTVTEIGERAFNNNGGFYYFFGPAPHIAPDAFLHSHGACHYFYGWGEADIQNYGGQINWWKDAASVSDSIKTVYGLHEQIRVEDIVLVASPNGAAIPFVPSRVEIGAYDNSTPGQKQVQITTDYLTFPYTYWVSDGESHLEQAEGKLLSYMYYTGAALCPEPLVTAGDTVLVKDVHYTLSYENNIQAGTDARVNITGIGEWEGLSMTLTFQILKRDISGADPGCHDQDYLGMYQTPNTFLYFEGSNHVPPTLGTDYFVLYENNFNKGTATFHAVGTGSNYGVTTGEFLIGKERHYDDSYVLNGAYNGQAGGELNSELYYEELLIPPEPFVGKINSDNWHAAYYELYRLEGEESVLITTKETEYSTHYYTTFEYDFTPVYEEDMEAGGAVYMLAYTWVDSEAQVFSGVCLLAIPAKAPGATAMEVAQVEGAGDFRRRYYVAYGLDGVVENVRWESSDPAVAEVRNGIVTLKTPGTVTITTSFGELAASFEIQVSQLDITRCEVLEYDSQTGEVLICYEQIPLEAGVDYRVAVTEQAGQKYCTVTGTGLFEGELVFPIEEGKHHHTHSYSNCYYATCDECGFCRIPGHIPEGLWVHEGDAHWRYCTVCGSQVEREPHTEGAVCQICGFVAPMPGDINGDGKQNNKDVTRLMQYLAGWDVEVVELAVDVNGDGKQNNKDVTRLMQYLAGWDAEIH